MLFNYVKSRFRPQSFKSVVRAETYSTSVTLFQPANFFEYIPGVQGYAPGFGPPPLKPKKEKRSNKAKVNRVKNPAVNSDIDVLNQKPTAKNSTEDKKDFKIDKIANFEAQKKNSDSAVFIQKTINPLEISYSKKNEPSTSTLSSGNERA